QNAARELGLDLGTHRSRVLNVAQIAQADIIFIFDQAQEHFLRAAYPEAVAKIHYLGALGVARDPIIIDPWGRDPGEYGSVYRSILDVLKYPLDSPVTDMVTSHCADRLARRDRCAPRQA